MLETRWDPSRSIDTPLWARTPKLYTLPDVYAGVYTHQRLVIVFGIIHMTRRHRYVLRTAHADTCRAWMEDWSETYGPEAGSVLAREAYSHLRLLSPSVNTRRLLAIQKDAWPPNNIKVIAL